MIRSKESLNLVKCVFKEINHHPSHEDLKMWFDLLSEIGPTKIIELYELSVNLIYDRCHIIDQSNKRVKPVNWFIFSITKDRFIKTINFEMFKGELNNWCVRSTTGPLVVTPYMVVNHRGELLMFMERLDSLKLVKRTLLLSFLLSYTLIDE